MLAIHTGAAAAPDGHDDRKEKRHEEPVSDKGRLKISGYLQPQFQWGRGRRLPESGHAERQPVQVVQPVRTAPRSPQIRIRLQDGLGGGADRRQHREGRHSERCLYRRKGALAPDIRFAGRSLQPSFRSRNRNSPHRYARPPERSYIFPMLFPDERDFGAMLVIRAPEDSPWHIVGLQAGIFSGNGIGQDNDNRKDFIGHLSFGDEFDDFSFRAGASYYHGFVYQGTGTVHTMTDSGFRTETDPSNKGRYAKKDNITVSTHASGSRPTWVRPHCGASTSSARSPVHRPPAKAPIRRHCPHRTPTCVRSGAVTSFSPTTSRIRPSRW